MRTVQIADFEKYEVSDTGLVLSNAQLKPKILKGQKASQSKKKYLQVRLFNEDSPKTPKGHKLGKLFYIHRLVWEAFNGEIPEGKEIDHIDGNPRNNALDNLQVITRKNNIRKYYSEGDKNYYRDERDEIIKDYVELGSMKLVSDKWNMCPSSTWRVIKNRTHIYDFKKSKYVIRPWDELHQDLFAKTNLYNKTKEQLIELWEKNYGVKYGSEIG